MVLGKVFAVGMLGAAMPASAQHVMIYGRLNTALEAIHSSASSTQTSSGSVTRLSNYRSVLGFHGEEDLGNEVRTIWQIEGSLALDTGKGGLADRDTRLGLATPAGTIFGGNWTTPYTSSTSTHDPFYPTTAGYMRIMGNGSAPTSDNVIDTTAFDRRQRNSIHYWTPDWNGVSVRIAHGLSEEKSAGRAPALTSVAAIYEKGDWYATLAYELHRDYQGAGLSDRGTKIGLAYRFGATRIAGVVEKLRYETPTGALERNAFYVSATYKVGRHGIRLGVAHAQDGTGPSTETLGQLHSGPDTGAAHYTIGYDYSLSKQVSLFSYVSQIRNKRNAAYDFAINQVGNAPGTNLAAFAIGMRYAF
jgi:predicted porin